MRTRTRLLFAIPLLFALGCGGAFGKAMKRGDELMERGQWDLAAAEYERAVELKPGDGEANQKLRRVRVMQARDRVARARPLLAENDPVGALALLQEAARFDPQNVEARALLGEANTKVLDRADALLGSGEAEKAFELTTLVLQGTPDDARARSLDGQVRDTLAERAYDRADELLGDGKHGAALVELGAALQYVPGFRDATTRMADVSRELDKRLAFYAVIGRFGGDAGGLSVASEMSRATLAGSFGEARLLRVVSSTPPPSEGFVGIRLGGHVDGYRLDRKQSQSTQTCSYVCGKSVQTNQSHQTLTASLAEAQQRKRAAEADVTRFGGEVQTAERAYDDVARHVDRAELEVERAKLELDRCRQQNPTDAGACQPEENKLEAELRRLGAAQARLEGPQQTLDAARQGLADAEARRDQEAANIASYESQLGGTPATIEVERTCDHAYQVTRHDLTSTVNVTIRAEALREHSTVIDDMRSSYRAADDDVSFPAQPGRCAELSGGDPLELKSEADLKKDLATQASAMLKRQILAQYDAYRRSHLDRARKQSGAGLIDDAVDSYVRYLKATPAAVALTEAPDARTFILEAKRLSDATLEQVL